MHADNALLMSQCLGDLARMEACKAIYLVASSSCINWIKNSCLMVRDGWQVSWPATKTRAGVPSAQRTLVLLDWCGEVLCRSHNDVVKLKTGPGNLPSAQVWVIQ
ncbi:unnamed protein product [Caretta caretta]